MTLGLCGLASSTTRIVCPSGTVLARSVSVCLVSSQSASERMKTGTVTTVLPLCLFTCVPLACARVPWRVLGTARYRPSASQRSLQDQCRQLLCHLPQRSHRPVRHRQCP